MQSKMKCPVCTRTFQTKMDGVDWTVHEEDGSCKCGYNYYFAFGSTRTEYGPFMIIEHYTDSDSKRAWMRRLHRLYRWLWQAITMDGCIYIKESTPCQNG